MSGLFGSNIPKPTPAARMPDLNDPAALEARRRQQAAAQGRSGRQSTILSDALVGSRGALGA